MAKIWKYVAIITVAVLFIGAVCIGVGFLTGAAPLRLTAKFVQYFHVKDLIEQFMGALQGTPIIMPVL